MHEHKLIGDEGVNNGTKEGKGTHLPDFILVYCKRWLVCVVFTIRYSKKNTGCQSNMFLYTQPFVVFVFPYCKSVRSFRKLNQGNRSGNYDYDTKLRPTPTPFPFVAELSLMWLWHRLKVLIWNGSVNAVAAGEALAVMKTRFTQEASCWMWLFSDRILPIAQHHV